MSAMSRTRLCPPSQPTRYRALTRYGPSGPRTSAINQGSILASGRRASCPRRTSRRVRRRSPRAGPRVAVAGAAPPASGCRRADVRSTCKPPKGNRGVGRGLPLAASNRSAVLGSSGIAGSARRRRQPSEWAGLQQSLQHQQSAPCPRSSPANIRPVGPAPTTSTSVFLALTLPSPLVVGVGQRVWGTTGVLPQAPRCAID